LAGTTESGARAGSGRRVRGVAAVAGACLLGVLACAPKTLILPGGAPAGGTWLQPSGAADGTGAAPAGPAPPLRPLWRQDAGKPPVGGPLLDGRLVLQLTGESRLVAYEARTGARIGRRGFAEDWCAPVAAAGPDGALLVASLAGDKPQVRVYDRGARRWLWRLGLAACAAAAARGDTLVVAAESGEVVALAAADGAELWRWRGPAMYAVSPSWEGDRICAASVRGHVALLAASTGRLQWETTVGQGVRARPSMTAEAVFVSTSASEVVCLDRDTGQVRWRTAVGGLLSGVSVAPEVVLVGSSDFGVYGLSRDTGRVLWRYDTGGVVRGAPALVGPWAYAAGGAGEVVALEVASGALEWRASLDGPALTPVSAGAGLIAVTTQTGTVHAFGQEVER